VRVDAATLVGDQVELRYRGPDGRPRQQRYAVLLFRFDRGNVITPHGHRGMQSAHLVVEGSLRARTYDRLGETPGALVLRPAGDRRLDPGDVSSIGPARENVHWFVPLGERAATFDVLVTGLEAGGPDYQVQPVDPLAGTDLGDGTLRAPLLGFEESAAPLRPPLKLQSFQSRRYQGRLFTSSPSDPIFFLMSCIDQPVSDARVSASLLRRSRRRSR
jgi:hypothetical protein